MGVDQAKGGLATLQNNGSRRTTYRGYDAIIMKKDEEICEARGVAGMALEVTRIVAVGLANMFAIENFDLNSVCLDATATVAWRCGDLLMVVNSPDQDDNSKSIASVLYKNVAEAKLCDESSLNGTIKDYYGKPMPYMQVTAEFDGGGSIKVLQTKTDSISL